MSIRRIIYEGERIPTGYGIAYFDFWKDGLVCYPIPLNILIRSLRILRLRIICIGYPSKWERSLLAAYHLGRRSVWKEIEAPGIFVLTEEQKKLLLAALRETGFDDNVEALMEMARTYILIQAARGGQV